MLPTIGELTLLDFQEFFHRVAEPRGIVPSRLLLERYQYHHVGNITYDRCGIGEGRERWIYERYMRDI
jgi:hypothetical protein